MADRISNKDSFLAKKKTVKQPKALWQKRTAGIARWLHIYLSMASFVVVLFFAVTGLTLNHADWFGGQVKINKLAGTLNPRWVKTKDTTAVAKLAIVEFLRNKNSIKGSVSEFRIEDDHISVSFNGPGYAADTYIDRDNGRYKITETRFGLVAVLNDLHKGRDAGKSWAMVIDVTAMLLTIISLTGIVMICLMKKKRLSGLLMVITGAVVIGLIYYFFVK
jgi:hypothetical protein